MMINYSEYLDRVKGCFLGKTVIGTLGAPYEGVKMPMELKFDPAMIDTMLPNDDLDLQVLWLEVVERKGLDFTSLDLLKAFCENCDYSPGEYAVMRKNYEKGIYPPYSGCFCNDFYIGGMGCPIRSEIWASLSPGNPIQAMRLAGMDGILDHAGESVIAEQFLAALESLAFNGRNPGDVRELISFAAEFIPGESKVYELVKFVLKAAELYGDIKEVLTEILDRYGHLDCTNMLQNIGITVAALLYGEGDIIKTGMLALNCGFDTDCTCATAGAILGILTGAKKLRELYGWDGVKYVLGVRADRRSDLVEDLAEDIAALTLELSRSDRSNVEFEQAPPVALRFFEEEKPLSVIVEYPEELAGAVSGGSKDGAFGRFTGGAFGGFIGGAFGGSSGADASRRSGADKGKYSDADARYYPWGNPAFGRYNDVAVDLIFRNNTEDEMRIIYGLKLPENVELKERKTEARGRRSSGANRSGTNAFAVKFPGENNAGEEQGLVSIKLGPGEEHVEKLVFGMADAVGILWEKNIISCVIKGDVEDVFDFGISGNKIWRVTGPIWATKPATNEELLSGVENYWHLLPQASSEAESVDNVRRFHLNFEAGSYTDHFDPDELFGELPEGPCGGISEGRSGRLRGGISGGFSGEQSVGYSGENPGDGVSFSAASAAIPGSVAQGRGGRGIIARPYKIKTVEVREDSFELSDFSGFKGPCVFYLSQKLYAPSDMTVFAQVGYSSPFKFFVNGELVGERYDTPTWDAENAHFDNIRLKEGENRIVLRLARFNADAKYSLVLSKGLTCSTHYCCFGTRAF